MKKILDIKQKPIKSQSLGLTNSQIITRFTLKQIFDGRTKYGRPIKIISKIIYRSFETLMVIFVSATIAAIAVLWTM